jgi:hypothetical protein
VTVTAPHSKNVRIDALSIIANPQAKSTRIVADFRFDITGLGMRESIDQRLPPDGVGLLSDDGVQLEDGAFDNRFECG